METPKILLVEDDPTMLSLLHTLLRFEGFEVAQLDYFDQLEEILKTIHQERPDLILLDVHLHGHDGFEILSLIREDQLSNATRVLMSSGADLSDRCLEAGADGFILKPYMPEELINTIRQKLADNSHPE